MLDDQRPTLTLAAPKAGTNAPLSRILIGMYDYGSGLDLASFEVLADFAVNGVPAGQNLAPRFKSIGFGIYELVLSAPLRVERGKLSVSVRDKQGNVTRIDRTFSAGK
jgi:hypothetical protein